MNCRITLTLFKEMFLLLLFLHTSSLCIHLNQIYMPHAGTAVQLQLLQALQATGCLVCPGARSLATAGTARHLPCPGTMAPTFKWLLPCNMVTFEHDVQAASSEIALIMLTADSVYRRPHSYFSSKGMSLAYNVAFRRHYTAGHSCTGIFQRLQPVTSQTR